MIAVVILHANNSFWFYQGNDFWDTANVIESVFYFAVPIFFMLTGATLIDYRSRCSTREYFKRRIKKTVIPFLFWSVFGMFWASRQTIWGIITRQPNAHLDWTAASIIDGIINTKFTQIYWFFAPLFCIYLIIPFFAAIEEKRRVKMFSYMAAVTLVLNGVFPFFLSILKSEQNIQIGWPYTIYVGFNYLYYVLIGYVIHKRDIKKRYRIIIYLLAITGLLIHIIGTYCGSHKQGSVFQLYKGYYNLPCVLYSTGVFLFIKYASTYITKEKVMRVFLFLQRFSFPVYLIHRYILDVFKDYVVYTPLKYESLLYVILASIAALTLSILLTMLLRKIPLLRRTVP